MTSKLPSGCWIMGGAQTWHSSSTSGVRSGTIARLVLRPETMRVMGGPTSVALTLVRSWIQKWQKFSINFLISGINVWEIGRIEASTPWLMALQGTWRPYEDQPASLQGHRHQGCHHIPKLALGLNSVSLCWVPGSGSSPLCHTFLTRLPRGVGEEFRGRHYSGWCLHHTWWALQQCQGLGYFEPRTLSTMQGDKETISDWGCTCQDTSRFSHCHS